MPGRSAPVGHRAPPRARSPEQVLFDRIPPHRRKVFGHIRQFVIVAFPRDDWPAVLGPADSREGRQYLQRGTKASSPVLLHDTADCNGSAWSQSASSRALLRCEAFGQTARPTLTK